MARLKQKRKGPNRPIRIGHFAFVKRNAATGLVIDYVEDKFAVILFLDSITQLRMAREKEIYLEIAKNPHAQIEIIPKNQIIMYRLNDPLYEPLGLNESTYHRFEDIEHD